MFGLSRNQTALFEFFLLKETGHSFLFDVGKTGCINPAIRDPIVPTTRLIAVFSNRYTIEARLGRGFGVYLVNPFGAHICLSRHLLWLVTNQAVGHVFGPTWFD